MALIGIKLQVYDQTIALSGTYNLILFRTDLPLEILQVKAVKDDLISMLTISEVWWATHPYIKITFNTEIEERFKSRFRAERFLTPNKSRNPYLVDLVGFTGEPLPRLIRAENLSVHMVKIYMTDDALSTHDIVSNFH